MLNELFELQYAKFIFYNETAALNRNFENLSIISKEDTDCIKLIFILFTRIKRAKQEKEKQKSIKLPHT